MDHGFHLHHSLEFNVYFRGIHIVYCEDLLFVKPSIVKNQASCQDSLFHTSHLLEILGIPIFYGFPISESDASSGNTMVPNKLIFGLHFPLPRDTG